MPSMLHEVLVALVRNRPALVADLLRALSGAELPPSAEARVGSADFSDIKPAQYHADLVVLLEGQAIKHGLIVEVQLSIDERKRYTWPVYVYCLRAQLSCPVSLVIITPDEKVADWAAERVVTGVHNTFVPMVMSPSAMPGLLNEIPANRNPELAAVSAIMHVDSRDIGMATAALSMGLSALQSLPPDLARACFDLLHAQANDAVRQELPSMDFSKYEYQSEYVKQFIAMGREEGRTEGHAAVLIRQLTLRFGSLSQETQTHIRQATMEELDQISERVLTASTLQQALGALLTEA